VSGNLSFLPKKAKSAGSKFPHLSNQIKLLIRPDELMPEKSFQIFSGFTNEKEAAKIRAGKNPQQIESEDFRLIQYQQLRGNHAQSS
jgi:hypothetical protein